MNHAIDDIVKCYPATSQHWIHNILTIISDFDTAKFVYVGGAITFNRTDEFSDLDIHCVIDDKDEAMFWTLLDSYLNNKYFFRYKTKEKYYAWFGNMRTYYLKGNGIPYFDIGFVTERMAPEFYFQYSGQILKDQDDKLSNWVKSSEAKEPNKISHLLELHLDQVLSASIKIQKDVWRRLYWNATENLMQLRRAFIFLYSYEHYFSQKYPFIGRAERDIEKVWNENDLAILQQTIPDTSLDSILQSRDFLVDELLQLTCVKQRETLCKALQISLHKLGV